jgi:hypothetical protein
VNRATDLVYFTHEVDGRLYGGWYRLGAGSTIELYARGQVKKAKLGKLSADKKACRMLEEIVRTLERRAARASSD